MPDIRCDETGEVISIRDDCFYLAGKEGLPSKFFLSKSSVESIPDETKLLGKRSVNQKGFDLYRVCFPDGGSIDECLEACTEYVFSVNGKTARELFPNHSERYS